MRFWRKPCGKTERNKRAGSCILAVKMVGEFDCICYKRKICVVSEESGSCILNIFYKKYVQNLKYNVKRANIFL